MRTIGSGWVQVMVGLYPCIAFGAAGVEAALGRAGFPPGSGSLMVAMVCTVTALRFPRPVADRSLEWRVGAWGARIVSALVLLVGVFSAPLVPVWAAWAASAVTTGVALWLVHRMVQRWWSHLDDEAYQEAQ